MVRAKVRLERDRVLHRGGGLLEAALFAQVCPRLCHGCHAPGAIPASPWSSFSASSRRFALSQRVGVVVVEAHGLRRRRPDPLDRGFEQLDRRVGFPPLGEGCSEVADRTGLVS